MATNSNPVPEQPVATLTREGKWLFHVMWIRTHKPVQTYLSASSLTIEDYLELLYFLRVSVELSTASHLHSLWPAGSEAGGRDKVLSSVPS